MADHTPPQRRHGLADATEAILSLWITFTMFDNIIAAFKKLDGDDGALTGEIAALEQINTDLKAKQAADEDALTALATRVANLEGSVAGTANGFASAASVSALIDRVTAVETNLAALDAGVGALTPSPAPPTGVPIVVDVTNAPTDAVLNQPYSGSVRATGGSGPLIFVIDAGALPDGLSMAAGGAISGTPGTAGPFSADVAVSDANGDVGKGTVAITVAAAAPVATTGTGTVAATQAP